MGNGRQPQIASGRDAGNGATQRTASQAGDWFELTWNPTAGCSLLSPGCENCYAVRIAAQLARMGGATGARYTGLTTIERPGPRWTGEIRVAEDLLAWPLVRRRPRRIAVDVMSDLFHENLATATIDLLHAVMRAAYWHDFLVLTKRAARMRAYYGDPQTPDRIAERFAVLSSGALPGSSWRRPLLQRIVSAAGPATSARWPLPNLWLGVSVEDQDRIGRVRDLLETPAAIRWVCLEPLLDRVRPDAVPVGKTYFDALDGDHYAIDGRGRTVSAEGPAWRRLDWLVAGGEIGAGARPMHPQWLRELRDKCVARGVPFFFRQWGEWAPAGSDRTMTRVGKRAAGRVLDGRTWDEMPATA
jgi:protein gp37